MCHFRDYHPSGNSTEYAASQCFILGYAPCALDFEKFRCKSLLTKPHTYTIYLRKPNIKQELQAMLAWTRWLQIF